MSDRERTPPSPPLLARLVVRLCTPARLHEWIAGDLEETYHAIAAREGLRAAREWYWRQARAAAAPRWARRTAIDTRRGESAMTHLATDLRDSARLLLRSPGFTAIAVLMLALGIGVNTTVFSWLNAILLTPVPGARDTGRLVQFGTTFKGNIDTSFSYVDYRHLRTTAGFAGVAARSERPFTLTVPEAGAQRMASGAGAPERAWGELVSDNFFAVLGVEPALGRAFLPSETRGPGDAPVAVISDHVWARHFDRDPGVLGRRVLVNGRPVTIVGVAPPVFQGSVPALSMDLWLPVTQAALVAPDANDERLTASGWHWLEVVGRLAPGTTVDQGRAQFAATFAALAGQRSRRADVVGTVFLLRDAEGGSIGMLRPVLLVLAAVAGLVLLIACANLANLLLVRASRRRRELAVRVALGAGRPALMRLLLAESAVLAVAGGLAALVMTTWTSGLLAGFAPPSDAPVNLRVPLDGAVFAFTVAAATLTALLLGVLPAWTATSGNLVDALKDGTPGAGAGRRRLRGALVVVQVALSVVLLAAAGLCVRSLIKARSIQPGFNTSGVLLASLDLYPRASDNAVARGLYRSLLEGIRQAPGVSAVTLGMNVPLGLDGGSWTTITVDGYQPAPDERVSAAYNFVGPDYFRTLQTPVLRGRDFLLSDDERAERVVIVNEAMAKRYWPRGDALGSRVRFWDEQWMRVVGVVATTKQRELAGRGSPYFYVPMLQFPSETVTLHVRTAGDVAALTGVVRDVVHRVDSSLPLYGVRTFADHARAATFRQRLAGSLLSVLGLLALVLATVGLYGVLALVVGQRTREFGIRLALGATGRDLRRLVAREAGLLVVIGVAFGLGGALLVGRALEDLLIGVGPDDRVTLAVVALTLGGAALVACLAPARRAARLDPVQALRQE
jgi:predicted permease